MCDNAECEGSSQCQQQVKKNPKRFGGRAAKAGPMALVRTSAKIARQIPQELLDNLELKNAIDRLPSNYNFEIYKSIHQIKLNEAKRVALQFPEGLLMFSLTICDILEEFTDAETLVLADITYGACCIDDLAAKRLGCDFMIHYGHSCLIPVDVTTVKTLYVFVDIKFDLKHFVETVKLNFKKGSKIAVVATIQFVGSIPEAIRQLSGSYEFLVPQSKPLSKGEILGCTAPKIGEADWLLYIGDGRFHLEAVMIANPGIRAVRYDPYSKKLTNEGYDLETMKKIRSDAIGQAKNGKTFGLIQGTLGRQGSPSVTMFLEDKLIERNLPFIKVLLPEIFDAKLSLFPNVDVWIQVACPRLSIDWGYAFSKPLLTAYEAAVLFNETNIWSDSESQNYPMDFYSNSSLGPWTPYHKKQ